MMRPVPTAGSLDTTRGARPYLKQAQPPPQGPEAPCLRLRHTVSFKVRGASGCGPLPSADMTVSRRSLMGFWQVPRPNQE